MRERTLGRTRDALRRVAQTPGGVAALVWILMVGSALFYGATAASQNDVVTDTPDVSMVVGTSIVVGYEVQSAGGACDASAAAPIFLTFSAPPGVGVGPTPLPIAACDTFVYATVSASAIVTGQILVTASDGLGHTFNTFHASASIFVHSAQDAVAPVVVVPPQYVAEATSPAGARVGVTATATDPGDTVVSTSCLPKPLVYPLGVTDVTCSAKDSHGNIGVAFTKVIVVDTTPPAFSVPSDITLTPTGFPYVNWSTTTAVDVVDETDPVLCAPASGSLFPAGATTVACTSTDAHGNAATHAFRITILDRFAPNVAASPLTIEATSPAGATVASYANLIAWDFIDPAPTVSCAPAAGSTFPIGATSEGVTSVSCSAMDHSGNAASATFDVHVVDTTPPALSLPAPIVEATGPAGAAVTYAASATDAVDVSDPVSCAPASGSTFPPGATTVTCTSTDLHGNVATGSFVVTVRDSRAPIVLAPADVTLEATGPAGAAATFGATAQDDVDGALSATCAPASGSLFPIAPTTSGVTTVTCRATDAQGNTGSATFRVTVVDTTPPALTLPAPPRVYAVGSSTAIVPFATSASDLVDGATSVACAPASGSAFPVGSTTVACTSTDAHGNVGRASFVVTVVASSPPTLTLPPDITLEATSPGGAIARWSAFANDAIDGPLAVTCSPPSGSLFPLGPTIVTCSATNARGQTATDAFTVTVVDTTPPVLALPPGASAFALSSSSAIVTFATGATDVVDGVDAVTCTPPSGSAFPVGVTTVSCSSTDAHGNTARASFPVTVTRSDAPTLTLPSNRTLEATSPAGAAATFAASASDSLDGPLQVTCAPTSGSTFPLGPTIVSCSATNARNQTASGAFAITVVDTTPPRLALPAPSARATSQAGAVVNYSASATDIVDLTDAVSCAPASGSLFPVGDTLVTCTSTDRAGNRASGTFTVHVDPAPAVAACTVTDYRPPIDTPGHTKSGDNEFKDGSTVPVKIYVDCGGKPYAAPRFYYAPILPNGSLGAEKPGKSTSGAVGDNAFRPAGIQWLFNWDTKGLGAGAYRLRVDVGDGTLHVLSPFKLVGSGSSGGDERDNDSGGCTPPSKSSREDSKGDGRSR